MPKIGLPSSAMNVVEDDLIMDEAHVIHFYKDFAHGIIECICTNDMEGLSKHTDRLKSEVWQKGIRFLKKT